MFNRTAFKIRLAVLLVAILAGCGDVVQVTTVSLVSLSVTPADPSIAINTDQPFTATGIFSDNLMRDMTGLVSWSSSDASVATISDETDTGPSNTGLYTGTSTGGRFAHATGRVATGRSWICSAKKAVIQPKPLKPCNNVPEAFKKIDKHERVAALNALMPFFAARGCPFFAATGRVKQRQTISTASAVG